MWKLGKSCYNYQLCYCWMNKFEIDFTKFFARSRKWDFGAPMPALISCAQKQNHRNPTALINLRKTTQQLGCQRKTRPLPGRIVNLKTESRDLSTIWWSPRTIFQARRNECKSSDLAGWGFWRNLHRADSVDEQVHAGPAPPQNWPS